MKQIDSRFPLAPVAFALFTALSLGQTAFAQSENDEVIEEVVATGTRLKGTATAVLEERKNQAFVADILGAEQISRTGDSDAVSALLCNRFDTCRRKVYLRTRIMSAIPLRF